MDLENAKELKECLSCGSKNLTKTLDLGVQPLANSFIDDPAIPEHMFPLELNLCRNCFHLQLSHAVNPDLLFKNYLYVSGTSQTLRDYFDWFAKETLNYFSEKPASVLDIACNDGSQLNSFKALGIDTYGVDPAENLHPLSSKNHNVVCDYFNEAYVKQVDRTYDIITAQNVFAHNDYPVEFLRQCKELMHGGSLLFIQTSQADMVRNNEFDTIYHEHLSFFCANSMYELAKRAGLTLIDIRKTPIHGNSYMFVFSILKEPMSESVKAVLKEERDAGLQTPVTYTEYARRAETIVAELKKVIADYRADGYVIAGYGAAAKGMTLLNFGKISLDFIIDDNPLKQGLFTPGMHIPVVTIDMLDECEDLNVAFVPLAWNFFDEISQKIKTKRDRDGDAFIRYFPEVRVITKHTV